MNRKHVATSKEAFGRRNDQKNPSNMADNDAESETAKKKAPPTKKDAEMKQASNKTIPASTSTHAPYRPHFNPNSSNSGTVLLFVLLDLNFLLPTLIHCFLTQSQNQKNKLNAGHYGRI